MVTTLYVCINTRFILCILLQLQCVAIEVIATICCHTLYSSYLLPHAMQLLFVATCLAVCYLLPHAVQFAICCCMPCSLLFIATCCEVCYLLPHAVQLLFVAAIHCRMPYSFYSLLHAIQLPLRWLLHAAQFAIHCCRLYSLLPVATCPTVCYFLLHVM